MAVWAWIALGVGSFLVLSLLVGLVLAAVLSEIGRRVAELYESEEWATAPLNRALADPESKEEEAKVKRDRTIRLR